jgi:hypothetical protein
MGSAFRKAILFINLANPVHPVRIPLLLCVLCGNPSLVAALPLWAIRGHSLTPYRLGK